MVMKKRRLRSETDEIASAVSHNTQLLAQNGITPTVFPISVRQQGKVGYRRRY
jgi:hypothetical protein